VLGSVKNLIVALVLVGEYLIVGGFRYYFSRDRLLWRKVAIRKVSSKCQSLLNWFGFDVRYRLSRPDLFAHGKTYFMVCNHMSYLDILFLSAGEPAVFVTSVEMKQTPFLGECSAFGGSYFVERRGRSRIPAEIKDLAQLLHDGFHVFVFPEATSHDGLSLLPFKKAMFTAAIAAGAEVLPVCLRIEEVNGEPFSRKNNDLLCWYGKMPFVKHFLKMITLKSAKVTVEYLEPIPANQFPDRSQLSDRAYQQISHCYFSNRPAEFVESVATQQSSIGLNQES
jgi:lyso-ornithine lipid O-acyltransferase